MDSLKLRVLTLSINILKSMVQFLGNKSNTILAEMSAQLSPSILIRTPRGSIHFFCPDRLLVWRAESVLTKEPETLEWIDSFEEGSVFWDIGANVGVFSLYASLKPGINVLAFEPASPNYYVLNKNIELNQMTERIQSFCIAFNDSSCIDQLHMSQTHPGSALHSFSGLKGVDGKPYQQATFKQGMVGFQIDQFIENFDPAFPNHIKIDVDGNEDKIIAGAKNTLSDPRVKSVLIELDTKQTALQKEVSQALEQAGLSLDSQKRSLVLDDGPYASIYNHIFIRK